MFRDESVHDGTALIAEEILVDSAGEKWNRDVRDRAASALGSYRVKLGRETIWLPPVEYSILRLLAARPYRPVSRARIVEAIRANDFPVTDRSLSDYIRSLRTRLGFFRDYIQAVPYMGYRFKP